MTERSEEYRRFHREYSYLKDQWEAFDANLAKCELASPFVALDVGCGSGAYSSERIARHGGHVIAIDTDPKSIDQAKGRLLLSTHENYGNEHALDGVSFQLCNAEAMPFKANTFDLLVSRGGLRHCNDWHIAFRECIRVLKKNGFLIDVEIILPGALIPLWKTVDSAQDRNEQYWEFPSLMSAIHVKPIHVVQMIHETATRPLDGFLEAVPDSSDKQRFREAILSLSEPVQQAINLREEISVSGQKVVVFDYHLLNFLLTTRTGDDHWR